MNVEGAELLDSELLKDAEATAQRPALGAAPDEIKTVTRLPSIPPPLPPPVTGVLATQPLPVAFPPASRVPSLPQAAHGARGAAPSVPPKPSWLDALLTTTFPPPASDAPAARVARVRAGVACVGFSLVFALVAMITGLRGAPEDAATAPVVASALILAHAIVALGAGAFSFGLLRMAERLLGE